MGRTKIHALWVEPVRRREVNVVDGVQAPAALPSGGVALGIKNVFRPAQVMVAGHPKPFGNEACAVLPEILQIKII